MYLMYAYMIYHVYDKCVYYRCIFLHVQLFIQTYVDLFMTEQDFVRMLAWNPIETISGRTFSPVAWLRAQSVLHRGPGHSYQYLGTAQFAIVNQSSPTQSVIQKAIIWVALQVPLPYLGIYVKSSLTNLSELFDS